MGLHSIKPELPALNLTEKQRIGIANFLNHYNGRHPVAVVRNPPDGTCSLYYYATDYWEHWYNAEDWANEYSYGKHQLYIDDIYIFWDKLPRPFTPYKEYIRHD